MLFSLLLTALLLVGPGACDDTSPKDPSEVVELDTLLGSDTAGASDTATTPVDAPPSDLAEDTEDPDTSALLDTDEGTDTTLYSDTTRDTTQELPPNCGRLELAEVDTFELTMAAHVPPHTGRSFRVGLSHSLDCHQHPAMPLVQYDTAAHRVNIQARVWNEPMDCDGPSILLQRTLTLKIANAGTWSIVAAGPNAEVVTVQLGDPPPIACATTPSLDCMQDCDCATNQVCLSGVGQSGDFLQCATPCEFDTDCPSGRCVSALDGLERTCDTAASECVDVHDCPVGFGCEDGQCAADFMLNGTSRHLCSCDAECDAPLRCVVSEPGIAARCELPCNTARGGISYANDWCGPMHYCLDAAGDDHDSVCQWVGE